MLQHPVTIELNAYRVEVASAIEVVAFVSAQLAVGVNQHVAIRRDLAVHQVITGAGGVVTRAGRVDLV